MKPNPKPPLSRKKPQPRLQARLHADQSVSLTIEIDGLTLQSDAACRKFWLVDHQGPVNAKLNCHGVMIRPQLILKLLCRLTEEQTRMVRRRLALQAVREGGMRLW